MNQAQGPTDRPDQQDDPSMPAQQTDLHRIELDRFAQQLSMLAPRAAACQIAPGDASHRTSDNVTAPSPGRQSWAAALLASWSLGALAGALGMFLLLHPDSPSRGATPQTAMAPTASAASSDAENRENETAIDSRITSVPSTSDRNAPQPATDVGVARQEPTKTYGSPDAYTVATVGMRHGVTWDILTPNRLAFAESAQGDSRLSVRMRSWPSTDDDETVAERQSDTDAPGPRTAPESSPAPLVKQRDILRSLLKQYGAI